MKAKSMKLRTLVTLHAIMKYSDENHRMNSIKLNEYLKPYGLDCTRRVLSDTVRVMREFGIDVQSKGEWDNQGIWLKDRPLPNEDLNALIYAVTTNPYLSKEEAERILGTLTPIVTLYQEPLLKSYIEKPYYNNPDPAMYQKYITICDAISSKRRVRYRIPDYKYHKETQSIEIIDQWPTLFTPKSIYQHENKLYMLGYNHGDKKTDAVAIDKISEIKIAFKHKDPKVDQVERILEPIDVQQFIKERFSTLIYEGEVTFKCRGQYATYLYQQFGPPSGPVKKDYRGRTIYTVENALIYEETLTELTRISDNNIRIIGTVKAIKAIREYYSKKAEEILNPVIPATSKK